MSATKTSRLRASSAKAIREAGELGWRVAAGAAQAKAGVGGGGVDLRGGEIARLVVGVGDAKSSLVLAESIDRRCGLLKPGGVTELEGDARCGGAVERGKAEEVRSQKAGVCLEVWRKLEEQGAQTADGGDRRERRKRIELPERPHSRSLAEVSDALRGLEGETEVRWGRGEPTLEHLCRGQGTEGVVHLNRVERREL